MNNRPRNPSRIPASLPRANRRRAWRARRSAPALVHVRPGGDRRLWPARNRGRPRFRDRHRCGRPRIISWRRCRGFGDRNAAERLANIKLYVPRDRLPEPEQADEFYHADLIGLAVVDRAGEKLGTVIAIHNFGAGDLIEVRPDAGGNTELVPFDATHVPAVDIAAGRIVVAPPEGTFAPSPLAGEGGEAKPSRVRGTRKNNPLTRPPSARADSVHPLPQGERVRCGGRAFSPSSRRCFRDRWVRASPARRWRPARGRSTSSIFARFATDKHRTVDDTPAGGGPGMVMKADVLGRAIDATATDDRPRLLLSPRGAPLTQARVEALGPRRRAPS